MLAIKYAHTCARAHKHTKKKRRREKESCKHASQTPLPHYQLSKFCKEKHEHLKPVKTEARLLPRLYDKQLIKNKPNHHQRQDLSGFKAKLDDVRTNKI